MPFRDCTPQADVEPRADHSTSGKFSVFASIDSGIESGPRLPPCKYFNEQAQRVNLLPLLYACQDRDDQAVLATSQFKLKLRANRARTLGPILCALLSRYGCRDIVAAISLRIANNLGFLQSVCHPRDLNLT